MARYFSKPSAWVGEDLYSDDAPMIPPLFVPEHQATDIGLLDADGNTIWRAPNPVGFLKDSEW
jgi:hypothetical protein